MGFPGGVDSTKTHFDANGGRRTPQQPMTNGNLGADGVLDRQQQAQDERGIGIVVGQKGAGQHFVKVLIMGQPAAVHGGLMEGDILLEVNGTKLEGRSVQAVSQLLRGPVGSSFALRVSRAGSQAPFSVSVSNGVGDRAANGARGANGQRGYEMFQAKATAAGAERNVSVNQAPKTQTKDLVGHYVERENGQDSFEQELEYLDPAPIIPDLQRDDLPESFDGKQHAANLNGSKQSQQSALLASDPPANRPQGDGSNSSSFIPSPPPRPLHFQMGGEQQQM